MYNLPAHSPQSKQQSTHLQTPLPTTLRCNLPKSGQDHHHPLPPKEIIKNNKHKVQITGIRVHF